MTRVEVVTTHVDGRRVRTVIRPAAEAGTYHEHQENPTMPSPVKRSRRSLEDALDRAATRVETTEQAYHVAAAEVIRLRESAETMRRDVRNAEAGEQAAHDAAAASARLLNERSHSLTAMTGRAARLEQERDDARHEANAYESALSRVRHAMGLADDATTDDMAARAENPRPLTADDITDEMVERGAEKFRGLPTALSAHARVRTIIRAALTPPPSRPEGAEELGRIMSELAGHALSAEAVTEYADRLAERGVRVITEEEER